MIPSYVTSALAGDWNELIRRHTSHVNGIAWRFFRYDPETARDAAQNIWTKVIARLETFEGRCAFGTWLYRLAMNECLMEQRRRGRRIVTVAFDDIVVNGKEHDDQAVTFDPPHEDSALRSLPARDALNKVWSRLGANDRHAIALHDILGYQFDEMAELTGMGPAALKSRVFRGRRDAKRRLEGRV
jgi:RNA polymerase sigma-70 factor (ECF subfamily)